MKKPLTKASAVILAGALGLGAMSSMAFAEDRINVKVNGELVDFPDAKPFIDKNSRTLVPLRAIGEALGLEATWNDANKTAFFQNDFTAVIFTIGKSTYEVSSQRGARYEEMDTKAIISEDRTYAPARYLAEAFGYTVGWDNDTRTVTINNKSGEYPEPENPNGTTEEDLFAKLSESFYFSSGAGGWGTELVILPDGSFEGSFHDSEMGSTGPEYPKGSLYLSIFKGKFSAPEKVNDYTYSMKLLNIEYENEADTEEIADEMRIIYSKAYGLEGCDTFYIYTPDAPVSALPEEFKSWVFELRENPYKEALGFYGIYGLPGEYGFTSFNGVEAVG